MARSRSRSTGRGVSEVVGLTLLFGLVIVAASLVALSGVVMKDEVSQQNRMESAKASMQTLDSEIGTLTRHGTGPASAGIDLSDREAESVSLGESDTLTIQVNGDPDCTATVPMDQLEYDVDDGGTLTYQAGGVFETTSAGPTMVTPPEVGYDDGVVQVTTVAFRGNPGTDFTATKNVENSTRLTDERKAALFDDTSCFRPDEVRLVVRSQEFHPVWADYLREEMPSGATVTHDRANRRVVVTLDQSLLAERADDDRNDVVDFRTNDELGEIADVDADPTPELIVDKPDDSNEYNATAKLLHSRFATYEKDEKEVPVHEKKKVPEYGTKKIPFYLQIDPDNSGSNVPLTNPWHYVKRYNRSLEGFSAPVYVVVFADNADWGEAPPRANVGKSSYSIVGNRVKIHPSHEPTNDVYMVYKAGCSSSKLKFISETAAYDNEILLGGRTVIPNTNGARPRSVYAAGGDKCTDDGRQFYYDKKYFEGYKWKKVKVGTKMITIHRLVSRPVDVSISTPTEGKRYVTDGPSPVERAVNYRRSVPPNGVRIDDGEPVSIDATFYDCAEHHYNEVRKVPHGGKIYNVTTCTGTTGPVGSTTVHTFTDGDPVPSGSPEWFEKTPKEILGPKYTDGSGHFDLDSNQVILIYEYDHPGSMDYNNAIVLYEAGTAVSEAPGDWIVDLSVTDVSLTEEDADR